MRARRLLSLGADPRAADALVAAWRDPLARAATVATAAGPPLVRAWLAAVGQTTGLQRLLSERLVPTMLRSEIHDAAPLTGPSTCCSSGAGSPRCAAPGLCGGMDSTDRS